MPLTGRRPRVSLIHKRICHHVPSQDVVDMVGIAGRSWQLHGHARFLLFSMGVLQSQDLAASGGV
jgi:hypothetical protein